MAIRRYSINVNPRHAEYLVTDVFKRQAHDQLPAGKIPVDEIEWLAVIQHFGGPTRLLDWTRSPFVALYFAIADATAPNGSAAVWAVDGEWCRKQAQAVFEAEGNIPHDWSERVVSR